MNPPQRRATRWLAANGRRLAWGIFALECAIFLGWATRAVLAEPQLTGDATIHEGGTRFGKSEAERREIFKQLVAGEPIDRKHAASESETAVWNRNHDDFFHQYEWPRVASAANRARIQVWQAWLILDEGFRGHWAPPPGVEIRYDDAPLARTTAPLERRPIMLATPPAAPPAK
jgi:hypothetical protein